MQIHFALSEPPRWTGDERLAGTAIVHVTPGLDGVSRAVNEAERGLLPAEATIVCGQPLAIDPSRAPDGKGMLWIQLQELPWHGQGRRSRRARHRRRLLDGGLFASGTPTASRLGSRQHIPNLESSILQRVSLSPADLQAANPNLHHGDPYSGSLALDQNFLWRPFAGRPGHRTGSTASGRSARAPGPAPASARAPGRSSPRSC